MKCDELEAEQWLDYSGEPSPCYPQKEVDSAIDELKREHHRERDEYIEMVAQLKAELVEQEYENRKLKRALWLARASEASKEVNYWTTQDESSYAIVDFNVRHETIVSHKSPYHRPYKWILIWENVERKCLKKAEEFV